MEGHYNGLETFPFNNCMGQVWDIAEYGDDGERSGTAYETEIVYQPKGERAVRIPESEFPDIVRAMRHALEYVEKQKGVIDTQPLVTPLP